MNNLKPYREQSRTSLAAYLISLLVIALISSFFAIMSIFNSIRLERTGFLGTISSLIETARLELQVDITRAYEAAESLTKNESLIRWFSGNDDPVIRELALSQLESLTDDRRFETSFAARTDTEDFYLGSVLTDRLSRSDPDDSWFYETISMNKPIALNVDHNRELGRTLLWVNAQINSGGEVIGAAGIGINLDNIMERLSRLAPGRNGMILFADELGRIKLSYPPEMQNRNLSVVLNDRTKKFVNLDGSSLYSFTRKDTVFTILELEDLNLKMVVMVPVRDFLEPMISPGRISSFLSVLLFLILGLVFLGVIQKLRLTISRQKKSQDITIHAMSMLAELKDHETGAHIVRTSHYCRILAEELSKLPDYKNYLTRTYVEDLERSAPLHDIGKVGIPDSILLKPEKLNAEEFEVIKGHPLMGAKILGDAMERLDFSSYFTIGAQLVRHHHEWWDGSGYPDGLAGEEIPLSARIMAVADVYDALRTTRPYKKAFSHEKAGIIIQEGSGSHFQPELVEAFIRKEEDFRRISEQNSDES